MAYAPMPDLILAVSEHYRERALARLAQEPWREVSKKDASHIVDGMHRCSYCRSLVLLRNCENCGAPR